MDTDPFDLTSENHSPDPERDTALLLDGFFEHLGATLAGHRLPAELLGLVRERHAELLVTNLPSAVDDLARQHLRLTLALIAAFELLRPPLGSTAAVDAVRRAFVEPFGSTVREATRAMLDAAEDPFRAMVGVARTRENQYYGAAFEFRHAADDDRHFHQDVHRCFYQEVLAENSASELGPVLCAFDESWIGAVDPAVHGFRFERATTLALGGAHCPFHFSRES
ncbi:L-2-amino-thiazoline-4-carboxylic acid hydrolase [Saccharopolyspora kobensis]|uniref:L-2-amino-thiazoline-4-carboxylic acid hydrolase n=1 Tax=Saccharopolyspora kobensis TaxID=146035 RepID=A0A1H6DDP7_9PSEU|nr:L-2-amino-thiazoline-4-carboxylic acid hydrolase [Saccharopolyspora kobensis]SEG83351.1 L-2-amino-thiazoline-4-carboxylic acid hydrolase [Saccharopolyspora kobensis]SFE30365.1 L-2-amino-thiazoline-4-carboxylic acid hydrolase [Saccharopolyspora kobensis]